MNRTMKFGLIIAVILGTVGWIAIGGVGESASYYKQIAEIDKMDASAKDRKLRVSGFVEAGTIKRNGNVVEFGMVEEGHKMRVLYTGSEPLPDTFKDGSQALVDGRLNNGVFHATKISAKCASKYEAKPGQNYKGTASYEKKV